MLLTYRTVTTRLGTLGYAASAQGIAVLQWVDPDMLAVWVAQLASLYSQAELACAPELYPDLAVWLQSYSQAEIGSPPAVPLAWVGSAFQQQVWQALLNIPYGQTCSYSDIAQAIGRPQAVRAVASACAQNQIAVLVPCHRVLRKNGDLGGFRWGLELKQALLDVEKTQR